MDSLAFKDKEIESIRTRSAAAVKNAGLRADVTKACESSESKPGPRSPKARRAPVQGHPAASAAQKYTVTAGKDAAGLQSA